MVAVSNSTTMGTVYTAVGNTISCVMKLGEDSPGGKPYFIELVERLRDLNNWLFDRGFVVTDFMPKGLVRFSDNVGDAFQQTSPVLTLAKVFKDGDNFASDCTNCFYLLFQAPKDGIMSAEGAGEKKVISDKEGNALEGAKFKDFRMYALASSISSALSFSKLAIFASTQFPKISGLAFHPLVSKSLTTALPVAGAVKVFIEGSIYTNDTIAAVTRAKEAASALKDFDLSTDEGVKLAALRQKKANALRPIHEATKNLKNTIGWFTTFTRRSKTGEEKRVLGMFSTQTEQALAAVKLEKALKCCSANQLTETESQDLKSLEAKRAALVSAVSAQRYQVTLNVIALVDTATKVVSVVAVFGVFGTTTAAVAAGAGAGAGAVSFTINFVFLFVERERAYSKEDLTHAIKQIEDLAKSKTG